MPELVCDVITREDYTQAVVRRNHPISNLDVGLEPLAS
jgi:hypothetical protein